MLEDPTIRIDSSPNPTGNPQFSPPRKRKSLIFWIVALLIPLGGVAGYYAVHIFDRLHQQAARTTPGHMDEYVNKIIFVTGTDEQPQLFSMNPDGSDRQPLIDEDFVGYDHAVSPDGSTIAFVSGVKFSPDDNTIYTMNTDGSRCRQLMDTQDIPGIHPQFTPDSRHLVFLARPDKDLMAGTLAVANVYGPCTVSYLAKRLSISTFTISPDGERIAAKDKTGKLWLMHIDGSGLRQIANTGRTDRSDGMAFSPDGHTLLFSKAAGDNEDIYPAELYAYELESGATRLVVKGPHPTNVDPAFSPDGTKIVFTSGTEDNNWLTGTLYLVNTDGTGLRRLTPDVPEDKIICYLNPIFTPDGTRILYQQSIEGPQPDGSRNEIHSITVDGADNTRLAAGGVPCWLRYAPEFAPTRTRDRVTELTPDEITRLGCADYADRFMTVTKDESAAGEDRAYLFYFAFARDAHDARLRQLPAEDQQRIRELRKILQEWSDITMQIAEEVAEGGNLYGHLHARGHAPIEDLVGNAITQTARASNVQARASAEKDLAAIESKVRKLATHKFSGTEFAVRYEKDFNKESYPKMQALLPKLRATLQSQPDPLAQQVARHALEVLEWTDL